MVETESFEVQIAIFHEFTRVQDFNPRSTIP